MSVELNWETFTSGPDGEALALRIRDFIHAKFQAVALPRFIKSVTVHDFEFGTIPPQLELKDVTDPLPDFYEDHEDYGDDEDEDDGGTVSGRGGTPGKRRQMEERLASDSPSRAGLAGAAGSSAWDLTSPFLGVSTPGILGAASNLHYFHNHMGTGWSGTQTPLAAVAGAHMAGSGWLEAGVSAMSSPAPSPSRSPLGRGGFRIPGADDVNFHSPSHSRNPSQSSISVGDFNASSLGGFTPHQNIPGNSATGTGGSSKPILREKSSVSTLAPTSVGTSRPPTRDTTQLPDSSAIDEEDNDDPSSSSANRAHEGEEGEEEEEEEEGADGHQPRFREPRPEDIQAVFRIRYQGDVRLRLTAEILLDYPMPSFVGIPVQLSVTGLSFDGVGVMAHIRKRVHFCFLSPEDALTAVGLPDDESDEDDGPSRHGHGSTGDSGGSEGMGAAGSGGGGKKKKRFGGLLQEIRVESEIGLREGGKQSLKNVGKVERFVLEQVRRIFENEFVYPSFWTFLV